MLHLPAGPVLLVEEGLPLREGPGGEGDLLSGGERARGSEGARPWSRVFGKRYWLLALGGGLAARAPEGRAPVVVGAAPALAEVVLQGLDELAGGGVNRHGAGMGLEWWQCMGVGCVLWKEVGGLGKGRRGCGNREYILGNWLRDNRTILEAMGDNRIVAGQ